MLLLVDVDRQRRLGAFTVKWWHALTPLAVVALARRLAGILRVRWRDGCRTMPSSDAREQFRCLPPPYSLKTLAGSDASRSSARGVFTFSIGIDTGGQQLSIQGSDALKVKNSMADTLEAEGLQSLPRRIGHHHCSARRIESMLRHGEVCEGSRHRAQWNPTAQQHGHHGDFDVVDDARLK